MKSNICTGIRESKRKRKATELKWINLHSFYGIILMALKKLEAFLDDLSFVQGFNTRIHLPWS